MRSSKVLQDSYKIFERLHDSSMIARILQDVILQDSCEIFYHLFPGLGTIMQDAGKWKHEHTQQTWSSQRRDTHNIVSKRTCFFLAGFLLVIEKGVL